MASSAMERHEQALHMGGPLARRAALVVAILAAFLAVSQVYGENKVKNILKAETRIVAHQVTGHPDSPATIARIEAKVAEDEDAHHNLELAVVFLEIGIVLSTVAGLLGVLQLLGVGSALGAVGVVYSMVGLLG